MSDPRLEAMLAELRGHIELPPAPDVTPVVRARIAQPPRDETAEPPRGGPAPRRRAWRLGPAFAVPVVAAAVAIAGLAASPFARSTVLRWLGLEGVRIERVPQTPRAPATPAPTPTPGDLGGRTTLAAARARVGYRPVVPRDGALGPLRGVYVEGERVTLRYAHALLSEFPGRTRAEFVRKTAGPRTRIEPVTVDGGRGFWISGAPHVLVFEDPSGEIRESPPRLAGSTLVWRRGRLTLRLEARVTRERALAIARSIR